MDKNTKPDNGNTGNSSPTGSKTEQGSGSGNDTGTGNTTKRKQAQSDIKENLVEETGQGTPKEVTVEVLAESPIDKAEIPAVKKRRKPKAKAKPKNENEKVKDIQGLLEGIFLITSLRAGEHWQIDSSESKQIAVPLANILERYDLLNKATEISDPLALVIATATITLPRIMLSRMSTSDKKKKVLTENGVINNEPKARSFDTDSGTNNGASDKRKSDDGEFIKAISNQVSEII